MTFTTPIFLVFLALFYVLYWICDRRLQNLLILIASLIFYGWWDWRFLAMLLVIAGVDYLVAHRLMTVTGSGRRKLLLAISLATNLGALGYFKYANFFIGSLRTALAGCGVSLSPLVLHVVLPVGISFYTFQALSYTIDVYRGQFSAVNSALEYFSFITFFPHMVCGPIQQAKHFLVQFHHERQFDREQSVDGLRQMLWGFFKKMVVADNLAPVVAAAYGHVGSVSGWRLLWATYLFAFQIYCDFSGYTDIAIGCARLFGLHMTRNFAYPYFATNIKEFWRRWHITLSNWFRDYVYIPLGGNRRGMRRTAINAFVVFVVSGLWHGANWTFPLWGALHGTYFYVYNRWAAGRTAPSDETTRLHLIPSPQSLLSMFVTFQLVCFAWIFFRAESLPAALAIVGKIGHALVSGGFERPQASAFRWVFLLVAMEWAHHGRRHGLEISHWPRPARWTAYYAVVVLILFYCHVGYTPFIYFQF